MNNVPLGRAGLSDTHAAVQNTKNGGALCTFSLLFSSSPLFSLQRWSMREGLGGWWLSLNDPVYFEKVSISASGFLSVNKEASRQYLSMRMCCMHSAADDTALAKSHQESDLYYWINVCSFHFRLCLIYINLR